MSSLLTRVDDALLPDCEFSTYLPTTGKYRDGSAHEREGPCTVPAFSVHIVILVQRDLGLSCYRL